MRKDVIDTVQQCKECLLFNEDAPQKHYYPLLVDEAFERVGIDLIGPILTV